MWSSRTWIFSWSPSLQDSRTLMNSIFPKNFVAPLWSSTHNSRTRTSHQLISLIRKRFSRKSLSSCSFQTPLSLKNSSTKFPLFLSSKKIFFIALRTSFTSYQLQFGEILPLITSLIEFSENLWFSFNREFILENSQIIFYVLHKTCRSLWELSNESKITQIGAIYRKL